MNRIFFVICVCIIFNEVSIIAQNGIVKYKYPDGSLESTLSFVDDIYDGTSYWFYPNGNIKMEKTYNVGKLNGWVKFYYETGLVQKEYFVENGVKEGLHKEYYENGGLKSVRSYEKGRLIKKIELDFDVNYCAPVDAYNAGNRQYALQDKKEELLCDVEICPIPIEGLRAIQDSLVYPEHAILYGLEGVVTLIATINENGDVERTEVIQGLGLGCDDAASLAVRKNKFLPGQQEGRSVKSNITLKVEFWLDENSKLAYNRQIGVEQIPLKQKVIIEEPGNQSETPVSESFKKQRREIGDAQNFVCDIEECPYPIGGLQSILYNLELPAIAGRVGLKGKVIIVATIDENGFVRDTKIIKGMGHGCSEAAEAALFDTEFYPGKVNGKAVRSDIEITIPIGE